VRPPRHLVHSEWFDYAMQQLGVLPQVDALLSEELSGYPLLVDQLKPGA
jgi:hypothetical protein